MDSAAFFRRYEERTASTFMQRTNCFVAVKDRRNVYGRRRLFVAKTRRSTPTMARPAGRALHRTALPFPGSVPAPFPIRSAQRERRSDSKMNRSKDDWFIGGLSTAKDDDAYFERRVQRTAPTMARPAGRTPH